jgi:uncharacterized tellurite resistance protein B-like protein
MRADGGRRARGELVAECALVKSLLADAGKAEPTADPAALRRVPAALEQLARLAPLEKQALLGEFADAVAADGQVTLIEHELIRALASALGCPMPPAIGALDPRLLRK